MDMSQVINHPFFAEVKKTGKTKEITEWCAKHDLRNLAGVVLMPELKDDSNLACKMLDDMLILMGEDKLFDSNPSDIAKNAVSEAEKVAGVERVSSKHEALVERKSLSSFIEEEEKPDLDEKSDVRSEQTELQGRVDPAEVEDLARDAPQPDGEAIEAIHAYVVDALSRAIPTIVTAVLDEADKRYININQDIELVVKER